MQPNRVTLTGSERKKIPNRKPIQGVGAKPNPNDIIQVTVTLRRKAPIADAILHAGHYEPSMYSRADVAAFHGATAMDMLSVTQFAAEHHLNVVEENALLCYIKLSGRVNDMEKAFGTELNNVQVAKAVYRERLGALAIPADLEGVILAVHGLDNRPQARPHIHPALTSPGGYSPQQVAKLYNFPAGDGTGQTIGIIELGGGFIQEDLNTYFSSLNLTSPGIIAKNVNGASNTPTNDPNGPDGEVMLDIEVAGAIANKARFNVYFAPNTDNGFLDAINEAIKDNVTVISISWGSAEDSWSEMSMSSYDKTFQTAALLGIPVTVASGDNGSTDKQVYDSQQTYGTGDVVRFIDKFTYQCLSDNTSGIAPGNANYWKKLSLPSLSVDFPASSPNVISCGGTNLSGSTAIASETVWNSVGGGGYHFGPGGGVSNYFSRPSYQQLITVPAPSNPRGGRGVPDICGDADPETGYKVRVDGQDIVIGGTSAVAPLWAALIAIMAQKTGKRVPFLNPILYKNPAALNDITSGTNDVGPGSGKYQAAHGWDACTGLGSPNGVAILALLNVTPAPKPKPNPTRPQPKPVPTHPHPKPVPKPHPHSGLGGGSGSSGNMASQQFAPLPQERPSNPILGPGQVVEEIGAHPDNIEAQSIVAIVAMASNVATAAITAITAISKKNS